MAPCTVLVEVESVLVVAEVERLPGHALEDVRPECFVVDFGCGVQAVTKSLAATEPRSATAENSNLPVSAVSVSRAGARG